MSPGGGMMYAKMNVYTNRRSRGLTKDQKKPRTEPLYRAFSSLETRL
jgi:hypothetical protein